MRLLGAVLAGLALLALTPGDASAHSGVQSYLYVSLFDDGAEARVEIPANDLAPVLGIDIPSDPDAADDAIDREAATIREYIAANTALGDADGPWTLDVAEEGEILDTAAGLYVVFDVAIDEQFDGAPRTFVADFSVIIESNPQRDALLIIENDWASARFANEGDHLLGFSVGMTEQVAVIESAPLLEAVGEVRGLGTDAVRTGIDLLLIVVAITLLSVMARGRDEPTAPASEIARRGGQNLLVFCGALTITLWASGFGLVPLDGRTPGIIVAVSLVAAATLVVVARYRALTSRSFTALVAVFGLAHGIGLGRAFADAGLDRRRVALGLIAFEAGVLVAIVITIACVVGPMLLVRRTRVADVFTLAISVVLVVYGVAWLAERALSADLPIERFANPLRVWPRNLWFVAAAIAVAAVVSRVDRSPTPALEEASGP